MPVVETWAHGTTRTLDSHAFRLRQKLNGDRDRFVVNGVGRRLTPGRRGSIEELIALELAGWLAAVQDGCSKASSAQPELGDRRDVFRELKAR
jgi:hypothetical protein